MNMRCSISLVFILKLGKIVIVKEENSPFLWRVFLCPLISFKYVINKSSLKVII